VVIAIITLLIAILLPTLARARQSAHFRICQSNLRQIHLASYMYAMDNGNMLPHRIVLGNTAYRQAPRTTTPDDKFALPEIFGLAAVLDANNYMDGNSGAWVCKAAPDWMQAYGNTYAHATPSTRIDTTPIDLLGHTVWVWDNYYWYPNRPTGVRGAPASMGTIPKSEQVPPHRFGGFFTNAIEGRNVVHTDGQVEYEYEKDGL